MKIQLICLAINVVCALINVACLVWIRREIKAAEHDQPYWPNGSTTLTYNGVTIPVMSASFNPDGTMDDAP